MRVLLFVGAFAGALAFAVPAQTETRVFIVASDADGYGVDRCLTTGASCGTVVATAYCQARDFSTARSFRKVDNDDVTGGGAKSQACGIGCDELAHQIGTDLVVRLPDHWTKRSNDAGALGTEPLHRLDRRSDDPAQRAAPAGVGGGDDTCRRVGE